MLCHRLGLRYRTAVVKHGFYPEGNGLLAVFYRLIQGVTGRKTAGQVRHHHAKSGCLAARFYGYRIVHGFLLLQPCLFQQRTHNANTHILLRMRNADVTGLCRVNKHMV
jgi:hypothetical protein